MEVAILIPCYNEEKTVGKVIDDFKKELPEAMIYVYDNNSKDKTSEIAKEHGAIVKREYRQGKGNVVRSMFRDINADVYVMVDGDDTYPAEFVHQLIEPITKGQANMTIGDRLSNGSYKGENKRKFHNLGNDMVKTFINLLFKSKLNDIMTGYRAFDKEFVKNMPVLSDGFQIETEITIHALHRKFLVEEIPIIYRDRPEGSFSKLNTFSDGFKVLKTIGGLFKDCKPMIFFTILFIVLLALGVFTGVPVINEFIKFRFIKKVPSAILAVGFVLLASISLLCAIILDNNVKTDRAAYELNLNRYREIEQERMKVNG